MAKTVSCKKAFVGLLKELFLQTFLLKRHTVNEPWTVWQML